MGTATFNGRAELMGIVIEKEVVNPDDLQLLQDLVVSAVNDGLVKAKQLGKTELGKLKMMSPMAAEATVVRNYIDLLVNVPWKKRTKVRNDLAKDLGPGALGTTFGGGHNLRRWPVSVCGHHRRPRCNQGGGPPGAGDGSLDADSRNLCPRPGHRHTGRRFSVGA